MAVHWKATAYPGVRYYEHDTRRTRNGQPDRYYAIRFSNHGKRKEEGVGWASEGWNPARIVSEVLGPIREGVRTGYGPFSLADMRARATAMEKADTEQEKRAIVAGMPVRSFFARYVLPRLQREKASWLTDKQRFDKELDGLLGDMPLAAVKEEDVQEAADYLTDKGYAAATVKQYIGIIKHLFNIATDTRIDGVRVYEGVNPAKGCTLPRVKNTRVRFAQPAEVWQLLEKAAELPSPDLHDAIIISVTTGLRLGEIVRQRWQDVDLYSGFLTVPDDDHRKPGGVVPIGPDARAVYLCRKELSGGRAADLVFPPVAGGVYRSALSASFRRIADTLGLNAGVVDRRYLLTFHSLRHTFASWHALNGTDLFRLQQLMRHKSIEMTMRYSHLIPSAAVDAAQKLRL